VGHVQVSGRENIRLDGGFNCPPPCVEGIQFFLQFRGAPVFWGLLEAWFARPGGGAELFCSPK